ERERPVEESPVVRLEPLDETAGEMEPGPDPGMTLEVIEQRRVRPVDRLAEDAVEVPHRLVEMEREHQPHRGAPVRHGLRRRHRPAPVAAWLRSQRNSRSRRGSASSPGSKVIDRRARCDPFSKIAWAGTVISRILRARARTPAGSAEARLPSASSATCDSTTGPSGTAIRTLKRVEAKGA